MTFIQNVINLAKKNKKTIVLPESLDTRILKATEQILKQDIANIILLGDKNEIKKKAADLDISKAIIIDPANSKLTKKLTQNLYELRKNKGMTLKDAYSLLESDYMYYACMLVKENIADGVVSGACHSSSNTLKPALQIIKCETSSVLASAFLILEIPNCSYGSNGLLLFSDSGLQQNPNSKQLADIAGQSSISFETLTGHKAVTALLSYSTKGSATHPDVSKVIDATKIAQKKYPQFIIDGELQLDAAIVPEISKIKSPDSKVAGKANVLIFPNLDSGNIGYKLVQRFTNAQAYGPITQGLAKPINDLSRGCSVEEIIGVVAITCIQAQKKIK